MRLAIPLIHCFLILLPNTLLHAQDAQDQPLEAFLDRYCISCHDSDEPKGDLDLTVMLSVQPNQLDPDLLESILERIVDRDMPPASSRRPDEQEYGWIEKWLRSRLDKVVVEITPPGRVAPRRLNRVEYANTIRDMLGVRFDVEDHFPSDDVGEGFDNIGEVLSMPPILLEKYLDAAETIAMSAVRPLDSPAPATWRVHPDRMSFKRKARNHRGIGWMSSRSACYGEFNVPVPGRYRMKATVFGQQAGDELVRLSMLVDGSSVSKITVAETRESPGRYEHEIELTEGPHMLGVGFLNDYFNPDDPDPGNRDRNAAVIEIALEGPLEPWPPTEFQVKVLEGTEQLRPDERLRLAVERMATLAWRRPPEPDRIDRLVELIELSTDDRDAIHDKLRVGLAALLVSPRFLFRIEPGPTGDVPARPLDGWEIASRLSYFLWSSMPDQELMDAAADGRLLETDGIIEQVDRMMQDPRSDALGRHFATQWLHIRDLPDRKPDPGRFKHVNRRLLGAMQEETISLFNSILREERPINTFLDADYTFVNEPLARHYGIEGIKGAGFIRVDLEGDPVGLLRHASILTATSNPTRTSPVKRGKWILESILDDPPKPPPPGVDGFPEDVGDLGNLALREMMARHRSDPDCAGCHVRMDALGLGLEHFDAIGRSRQTTADGPIDATIEMPDGTIYDGPGGVRDLLLEENALHGSLSRHMLTYALGRGLRKGDRPRVESLVLLLEQDPTLGTLIRGIVQLDVFRQQGS